MSVETTLAATLPDARAIRFAKVRIEAKRCKEEGEYLPIKGSGGLAAAEKYSILPRRGEALFAGHSSAR
jgi:hypothetical protein